MKRYRIQGQRIALPANSRVELNRNQAAARLHVIDGGKVKRGDMNTYTLTGSTEFKVGEELGYAGDVPKAWVEIMVDLDVLAEQEATEAAELEAKAERAEAARVAADQHNQLVTLFSTVQGNEKGEVSADVLGATIKSAGLNFQPTDEQAATAWEAVVHARGQ